MNDWKNRVGGDGWKNVIMLECEAASQMTLANHNDSVQSSRVNRDSIPFEYEIVGYDVVPSYIVWQTGRIFVVVPTEAALNRATSIASKFNLHHLHVVVLNWDWQANWKKLVELIEEHSLSVTIWTSRWIWNEILTTLANQADGSTYKRLSAAQVRESRDADNPFPSNDFLQIVAFEKELTEEFTCGVKISLSYTLYKKPCLRAVFRCNNERIVIDPALMWSGCPLTSSSNASEDVARDLDEWLKDIRIDCGKNSERFPELRDRLWTRYSELVDSFTAFSRPRAPEFRSGLLMIKDRGFDNPVYVTENWNAFEVNQSRASDATHAEDGAHSTDSHGSSILGNSIVVMLCGGLMKKHERELIDPGYELEIEIGGGLCGQSTERLSILEWRLHQLNEMTLVDGVSNSDTLPVVLITSPDTESIVRKCVARFKDRLQGKCFNISIVEVASQLVPFVKENPNGNFEVAKDNSDGGWQLYPRGHIDGVRFLAASNEHFPGKTVAIIVAFNNLGAVFDRETLQRLADIDGADHMFAVELFQYKKRLDDNDVRWRELSYTEDPKRPRLTKSWYDKAHAPNGCAWYSSLTWYINLKRLATAGLNDESLDELGYLIANGKTPVAPRQDIDQISLDSRFEIVGIPHAKGASTPGSLYAYKRYLGVRTHDHIRQAEFRSAFASIGNLDREFPHSTPDKTTPFLTTAPRYKEYVWGGHELARCKDLPEVYRENMRIAETWEVSTHEQGESSVIVNAAETVPLSRALAAWTEGKTKELPFMLKYVDCHAPLSIQVHPTRRIAEFLNRETTRSIREGGAKLRDSGGKEESFFVLKEAPGHDILHVFLGFEERKIAPLAASIKRSLEELVTSNGGDVKRRLKSISKTLGETLEEQCSKPILDFLYGKSIPTHGLERVFAPLKGSGVGSVSTDEIVNAFEYHLTRPREPQVNLPPDSSLDYLFSGIAVISMICELAFYLQEMARNSPAAWEAIKKNAWKLFGQEFVEKPPLAQDLSDADKHPILSFFHGCSVRANDWVRVPPGTIHSWQGGGNQLIEVSHRSDNTFRVLDFGRELSGHTRDMHYLPAMYALNSDSFSSSDTARTLITPAQEAQPETRLPICHDLIEYEFHRNKDRLELRSPDDTFAFLMNPDDEVRVTVDCGQPADTRVGARRTLIVNKAISMAVRPKQADNRVLFFVKVKRHGP